MQIKIEISLLEKPILGKVQFVNLQNTKSQESQAIILRTHKLPRNAHLLYAFFRSRGVLKISLSPSLLKQAGLACSSPLSEVHLRFRETKSSIYKGEDISAIHYHLENRKSLSCLQESIKLLRITETLYPPETSSEQAFDLLSFYLRSLPICRSPAVAGLSYFLKLLTFEGMLYFPKSFAEQNLAPYYSVDFGEFAPVKTPYAGSFILSDKQVRALYSLSQVRTKKDLQALEEDVSLVDLGLRLVQMILNR